MNRPPDSNPRRFTRGSFTLSAAVFMLTIKRNERAKSPLTISEMRTYWVTWQPPSDNRRQNAVPNRIPGLQSLGV
jgi:hypothetical protein